LGPGSTRRGRGKKKRRKGPSGLVLDRALLLRERRRKSEDRAGERKGKREKRGEVMPVSCFSLLVNGRKEKRGRKGKKEN